jgi:ESCRT-I complex subunit TSG101
MNDHRVTSAINKLKGVFRDVSRIIGDASSLIRSQVGQNLRPHPSSFIQNDGTTCHALLLSGTIPMSYRGAQYNVPIDLYLTPKYPLLPPVVYVRPINTMMIKEGHQHVGSDGMVYMPYFSQWNQYCNLVDACTQMSRIFSNEPPVFSKQPGWKPSGGRVTKPPATYEATPPPPRYEDIQVKISSNGHGHSISEKEQLERLAREADEANAVAAVARAAEAKEEQERKLTLEAKERLQQKSLELLNLHKEGIEHTVGNLLTDQVLMDKSSSYVQNQMKKLQDRRKELEDCNKEVDEVSERISSYINAAEEEMSNQNEICVDELALPKDIHSAQMLILSSENAAIKDALFFLDKALADRKVSLDAHLRSVRKLAKRQFLIKAHLLKIGQVKAAESFRSKNF